MSRITDAAHGMACALRLPGVCKSEPGNVVWAHDNKLDGGKAKGKKLARYDHIGYPACYWCHMVLDGQAKRPAHLPLEVVERAARRALREAEGILKDLGLWPSAEFLAAKPVTVQRIVKTVRTPEQRAARDAARAKEKSRDPVRAGGRGFPQKSGLSNTSDTRIVAGSASTKENAPKASRFPQGRKLQSANRLQSRSFGAK